jgi:peptidoglycan/xylan/chitin deacetylase (PgdA/CDA1 family)
MRSSAALVVTVDTEEEGLWAGSYRAIGNTCRNIENLPRVHEVFARHGVHPTYLVDYPVATSECAIKILGEMAAGDGAEIGAHLHPWCTPPFFPGGTRREVSYAHRLPPEVQEEKLEVLSRTLAEGFGARPRTYRAGRWGFDHSSVPVLERLGYTVDTSVDPLWWDPAPGGPSFVRAPVRPYRLDPTDAMRPGRSPVLEVPVSTGFTGGRVGAAFERVARRLAPLPGLRRWMVRAGLVSLKPEVYPLDRMCALADEIAARGLPVYNVMFHSSAALPGATPYVRDERALGAFLRRLDALLRYLVAHLHAVPIRLSEVPAWLGDDGRAAPSADWNRPTKRAAAAASE